jgi:hypothetical protein
MSFPAGVQIGRYEILALLGREGRATFIRPAIPDSTASSLSKLPAEKVADADRKRRFLLEAQAVKAGIIPTLSRSTTSLKSKVFASVRWSMLALGTGRFER